MDEEGVRFVWEAPPDIAAIIISDWRRGIGVELVMLVGDCCYYDMWFDLTQPHGPLREWRAVATAPTPSPGPTSTPPTMPTPAPRPTLTPTRTFAPTTAPRPKPSSGQSPLTAEFSSVPTSHNGEDAIQFRLRFSEPVSTSYKILRDTAIQVENGVILESKRLDGRNDLWSITVEPAGTEGMLITLSAPPECEDSAAVCTEAGKALSNSPTARVPYGG